MKSKNYKIYTIPIEKDENIPIEKQYSCYNYFSRSFIVKYNAFLPFFESLKHINFSNQQLILDLGCADGPFLPTLNHYAEHIVAMDISTEFMMESKCLVENKRSKLKKINLIQSDGLVLPFKDNLFD